MTNMTIKKVTRAIKEKMEISRFLDQLDDAREEYERSQQKRTATAHCWAYPEDNPDLLEWGGEDELLGF